MNAKYITLDTSVGPVAIVFPAFIQHSEALNPGGPKPRSAGFFSVRDGQVVVDPLQASTSLRIGPQPNDAEAIKVTLMLSGLRFAA